MTQTSSTICPDLATTPNESRIKSFCNHLIIRLLRTDQSPKIVPSMSLCWKIQLTHYFRSKTVYSLSLITLRIVILACQARKPTLPTKIRSSDSAEIQPLMTEVTARFNKGISVIIRSSRALFYQLKITSKIPLCNQYWPIIMLTPKAVT